MLHPYSRNLDNIELIEHFLYHVIQYDEPNDYELNVKIKVGEADLKNYGDTSATINSTSHRHKDYRNEDDRWKLRIQIAQELCNFNREKNDGDIVLGKGGALPESGVQAGGKAFIIIGLPASGKSSIANKISDHFKAVILDCDFAKRKLPEYEGNPAGASIVHEESDAIVFGNELFASNSKFKPVFEYCFENKLNIVVPKIGHNYEKIDDLTIGLSKLGYEVHLTLVSLDKRKATIRAVNRFKKQGRYVPLSLIFDGYGNDPALTYYRLKNKTFRTASIFKSFGKISTDVIKDNDPIIIETDKDNPACLFQ